MIILICRFSPSSGLMSTRHHKGATFNTSHPDAHKRIHTYTGRKVMRGRELKISTHILTFCHSFSLSLSSTQTHTDTHRHSLTVIVCLLHFFTHTCTNIPEPSKLESKVPIALLIRTAPGRVSKSKLCELQSLCMRWTSKLCLIRCIVAFLPPVNLPIV